MRVLIVEDELSLSRSLQQILQHEGYAVDLAFDGQAGYEMAVVEEYDALLIDIGLPQLDGISLCRQLRHDGVMAPILMLTARDEVSDKVASLDAGADDYVVKPFDIDEVLARLRSLLRRGKSESAILQVADVILDPAAKVVHRDGVRIRLSSREFAVLEMLMRYSGQIVSQQQILDHVWGADVDPFSNVVDVYIGYVRRKLTLNEGNRPLIETVKGLGYRMGDNV